MKRRMGHRGRIALPVTVEAISAANGELKQQMMCSAQSRRLVVYFSLTGFRLMTIGHQPGSICPDKLFLPSQAELFVCPCTLGEGSMAPVCGSKL